MGNKFLGVSYILLGIPYLGVIGVVLVPIAWVVEGFDKRRRLWIVSGFLGLLAIALAVTGAVQTVAAVYPILTKLSPQMGSLSNLSEQEIMQLMQEIKPYLMSGIVTFVAAALAGLAFFILMLVSLFQAGDLYLSNVIKVGAVLFITLFVFLIAGMGYVIASATYGNAEGLSKAVTYVGVGSLIINFLASFTSGVGFLLSRPAEESP
ncbi:MAG: hypothetical protein J7L55_05220 [Desulfurococcales archaeon]|nr:hypothetical protein [Desulfurococcales archaeon]